MFPSYLIVGAAKAGTTSLGRYLDSHPQVVPAWKKEIGYFDREFFRGTEWYRLNFPLRLRVRAREARLGRPVVCGEATPHYLFNPEVPERVHEVLPDVRIVALLREPVSRAYSQYWHVRELGQTARTFAAETQVELSDPRSAIGGFLPAPLRRYSRPATDVRAPQDLRRGFLVRGRYVEQLEQWFLLFPAERILVLSSKQLGEATAETYGTVCRFLGIDVDARSIFPQLNRGSYPPLDPAMREELRTYYAQPNQMLMEQLDAYRPEGAEILLDEIQRTW